MLGKYIFPGTPFGELHLHIFGAQSKVAPKYPTMTYWLFLIKITWEVAGVGRALWLLSVSLNAENKSPLKSALPALKGLRNNQSN